MDVPVNLLWAQSFEKNKKYVCFNLTQKGKSRAIESPLAETKTVLAAIHRWLKTRYPSRKSVHGFVSSKSIVSNASVHTRQRWVLNVDLEDYFGTVTYARVKGALMKPPYDLSEESAHIVSAVCMKSGRLPQGSPTSPVLANIVTWKLDKALEALASKHRAYYTRYADDLTFSTSRRDFPAVLALIGPDGKSHVGTDLSFTVELAGFKLQKSKTRLQGCFERQEVTGITVNQRCRASRPLVLRAKALTHAIREHGLLAAQAEYESRYAQLKHRRSGIHPPIEKIALGLISHIGNVNGKEDATYLRLMRDLCAHVPEYERLDLNTWPRLRRVFVSLRDKDPREDHLDEASFFRDRGYQLEVLLHEIARQEGLFTLEPFSRSSEAEQIDGVFQLGNFYVCECKWTKGKSPVNALSHLHMKVERSRESTYGVLLSINGWTSKVTSIAEDSRMRIILIDGEDLLAVLEEKSSFTELILGKTVGLVIKRLPYVPWDEAKRLASSSH